MKPSASLALISLFAAASFAAVQTHAQNAPAPAGNGSANNAGMQIANSGAPNGVAACASCHGARGEGNAAANFPRIAGQPQAYLAKQLHSYASGSRNNAVMAPIAKALSQQQIEAVSGYYAALTAPWTKPAKPPTAAAQKRGQLLATVGDNRISVQACANCHGAAGTGEPPNYPYLAGQHSGYLSAALAEWKNGARTNDPSQQMPMIAKRLSDQDAGALAAYYAALPPPVPAAQRINIPMGSAARPVAPGSGGGSQAGAAVPVQGVGIEQGAPTSGGSQGPGGGGAASGSGPSGSKSGDAQ